MSEGNDQDAGKGRLSLRPAGRMELGRTVDAGSVRQSFSHGRSKVVQVEVRKKRAPTPGVAPSAPPAPSGSSNVPVPAPRPAGGASGGRPGPGGRALTAAELATRQRPLNNQTMEPSNRPINDRVDTK